MWLHVSLIVRVYVRLVVYVVASVIGCLIVGLCGCVYVCGWSCACLCVVMCGCVSTARLCLFVCAPAPVHGKGESNGGDAVIKKRGGEFRCQNGGHFSYYNDAAHRCTCMYVHMC